MNKYRFVILFALFTKLIFSYELGEDKTKDLALTVYNDDFAVVKEKREIQIDKDEEYIVYKDVAKQIEADSVIVDGVDIKELNYEYDLLSKNKLLEKYIGKNIFIYDSETSIKKSYRLLSVFNGLLVEDLETKEVLIEPDGKIILPKNVEGLKLEPSLVWKIKKGSAKDEVGISYITQGINWKAKYVVNMTDKNLDLIAWVELNNRSGKEYKSVKLKLVAGDVKRIPTSRRERRVMRKSMKAGSMMYKDVGFEEKEFFDYHMYKLDGRVDIKNNQSKQMELLKVDNVKYEKYYSIDNMEKTADIIVKIENNKENMLGVPLPKGNIKVYKEDSEDGTLDFVGEDAIEHSSKDETIRLTIGKAFDIKSEFKELGRKKITKNSYEIEVEYELTNHKSEEAKIDLIHRIYGDWKIKSSNEKYVKENSEKLVYHLNLKKDEIKKIKFKYLIKY